MLQWKSLIALPAMLLVPALAYAEGSFGDALSEGEVSLDFRYRYEFVDQDNFSQDANASTLRTRLGYTSQAYRGWRLMLEADNVLELFVDDFNSGSGTSSPARNIYPVVADPDGTEINQAYLDYAFDDSTSLRFGRQRILLDNQRFVGGVGWRQNEQTYDGVSLRSKLGGGEFFYSFVYNVNRIFGDDVAAGDHEQDTHLLNYALPLSSTAKLTFYYYDIDNDDAAAFSTRTLGARYQGSRNVQDERAFVWGLEFARQSDRGNNPVDFDANYVRLDASLQILPTLNAFAGYEMLEGDRLRSGASFRTPLATLHAFNGWADQFLSTPDNGIQDTFVGLKGPAGKTNWQLILHDFQAESGSGDFGSELDASLGFKAWENANVLLKAAFFDGDAGRPDVTKLWFMLSYKF